MRGQQALVSSPQVGSDVAGYEAKREQKTSVSCVLYYESPRRAGEGLEDGQSVWQNTV